MSKLDELERLLIQAKLPSDVFSGKVGLYEIDKEDAALIAAMRNSIDALIAVARAAKQLLEGYKDGNPNSYQAYQLNQNALYRAVRALERGE